MTNSSQDLSMREDLMKKIEIIYVCNIFLLFIVAENIDLSKTVYSFIYLIRYG